MSSRFSAVLLAGGRSTRMGEDKAFVEIDGVPLWRRQLQMLQALRLHELLIAGPAHAEWQDAGAEIISDVEPDAGPLGGVAAGLRRCTAPLLLTIAIDLPAMTSDYLRMVLVLCSDNRGVVPSHGERFEPVAAVYPKRALLVAENCLASRDLSLQRFAARCLSDGLVEAKQITQNERSLFLNMNTPDDLARASAVALTQRRQSFTKRNRDFFNFVILCGLSVRHSIQ